MILVYICCVLITYFIGYFIGKVIKRKYSETKIVICHSVLLVICLIISRLVSSEIRLNVFIIGLAFVIGFGINQFKPK